MNGSGEAYQSWNSDQATATAVIALAARPGRLAAADIGLGDQLLEVDLGRTRCRVFSAMCPSAIVCP